MRVRESVCVCVKVRGGEGNSGHVMCHTCVMCHVSCARGREMGGKREGVRGRGMGGKKEWGRVRESVRVVCDVCVVCCVCVCLCVVCVCVCVRV